MSDGIFVSYAHADGFRSELIAAQCAHATVKATCRSVHDRGAR